MKKFFMMQIVFFVVFGYTAGVSFARAIELKKLEAQANILVSVPMQSLSYIDTNI